MTKIDCTEELRALLDKLQTPVLLAEVGPIAARVSWLCDRLDEFERAGQ